MIWRISHNRAHGNDRDCVAAQPKHASLLVLRTWPSRRREAERALGRLRRVCAPNRDDAHILVRRYGMLGRLVSHPFRQPAIPRGDDAVNRRHIFSGTGHALGLSANGLSRQRRSTARSRFMWTWRVFAGWWGGDVTGGAQKSPPISRPLGFSLSRQRLVASPGSFRFTALLRVPAPSIIMVRHW